METKLIKLNNHFVVENESKVLLFSQNPEHNLPTITFSDEVIAEWGKKLGIVDVEKLARNYGKSRVEVSTAWGSYADGYNQCLSDNVDNRFTLKDMKYCWNKAIETIQGTSLPEFNDWEDFIQSLTKQEFFCELEMEEQKDCNYCGKIIREQQKGCNEISCYRQYLKQPKITNNSIKVIKIWK